MRRATLPAGGWLAALSVIAGMAWACSSKDNDLFSDPGNGGQPSGGASSGGVSGSSSGTSPGGSSSGGASGAATGGSATGGSATGGSATGGSATGGTTTGGTTGEGGAAAESGTDTGGTATGGSGGAGTGGAGAATAGMSGSAGTPAIGGAGAGGAGAGGAGAGGAGTGGKAGKGDCKANGDCDPDEYCKKASCDAATGTCTARGPECRGTTAAFAPVCGCDGITYYNSCVIEHEGFNVASMGECSGNNRPTCTREQGGDSCPEREHAHCYRPVNACGDPSPTMGYCWVLPTECSDTEEETQRYCGGTDGSARCIGLCEVIGAENSFRRESPMCN